MIKKHRIVFFDGKKLFSLALAVSLALSMAACRGLSSQNSDGGGATGNTQSAVKRVIVIVMQNASFDHLFGTFTPPAGQTIDGLTPGVPGYTQPGSGGGSISPSLLTNTNPPDLGHSHANYVATVNGGSMDRFAQTVGNISMGYYDSSIMGMGTLWSLAGQFALADHFHSSALGSAPTNPLYLVAASDNNFIFSVQPFFGPCQKPDAAAQPFTFPNVGDQLTSKNVTWTWFHENYNACDLGYVATQNPFQYFTSTQNSEHIQDLTNFFAQLDNNTLPSVAFVNPGPVHSMHPGSGDVTAGLNWLTSTIQRVQASPAWSETAIVVIWDEGGGWYDHVNPPSKDSQGLGIRVPMLVISPMAKQGYVSHVVMDDVSILSFIQWNWSLGSLNGRNGQSGDMRDMFNF
jgi:phospholipase C